MICTWSLAKIPLVTFQNCLKFVCTITCTYKNFEISLVVFMPNITTNHMHAVTHTNIMGDELPLKSLAFNQFGSMPVLEEAMT